MLEAAVASSLDRLVQRLLEERNERGHWTGELSSSALSTATASIALTISGRRPDLVARGLGWLERTQNEDGGWGDTVLSISNISTTALCWAAYSIAGRESSQTRAAGEWLRNAAGSLDPQSLSRAIGARYGNDQTFSVPILTVLALAGRVPWDLVPQLPFELAALPQSWFRWLQLPVVSYALPALIAIGQVRHRSCPASNAVLRTLRDRVSERTLGVLERIQPAHGGFLEAIPLTSFVAMSLRAAGYEQHPVLLKALAFLENSVRADGSWPIDTNLATWVTTLSVNALREKLPAGERQTIREWLLAQQYRKVHSYTGAAPGGWAWTDLPGGVPDADDTAGALLALRNLGEVDRRVLEAAAAGTAWLLGLQNRDGGVATFCRGWGTLPFDRSTPDITAHALLAWCAWKDDLNPALGARCEQAMRRARTFLERAQRDDGAWIPLWFGNQFAENDGNPVYATARVLPALRDVQPESEMLQRAENWLVSVQNSDGGWGGDRAIASTVEETALAIASLAGSRSASMRLAADKGARWIAGTTSGGQTTPPSPIGLYFARLWYFERLYPLIFATTGLARVMDGAAQSVLAKQ